jgi:hypothetical protein
MATKKPPKTISLTVRMREPTRAKLAAAAKNRGTSLNSEVVDRLDRSLASDELGGPEVRNVIGLMAAAFVRGGQRGATARQHPEWSPEQWIDDEFCFQAATEAVIDALVLARPVEGSADNPLRDELLGFFARSVARGLPARVEQESDTAQAEKDEKDV